jgi:hypothetical protein
MTFNNKKTVSLSPGQKFDLCSEFDVTKGCMPFGYPGAVSGNLNNMRSLNDGVEATFAPTINSFGASGKFTYKVRKRANYL